MLTLHLNLRFSEIFKTYLLFFYCGIRAYAENFRRPGTKKPDPALIFKFITHKSKVKTHVVLPRTNRAACFCFLKSTHIYKLYTWEYTENDGLGRAVCRTEGKPEMTFSRGLAHTSSHSTAGNHPHGEQMASWPL